MSLVFDTESNSIETKEEVIYKILGYRNPFLRTLCKSFDFDHQDPVVLKENFVNTMNKYPSVGLSAPQVGIDARFFVIRNVGDNQFDDKYLCVINPEILDSSESEVSGEESCLSDMFLMGSVKRPEWIKVRFFDENKMQREFTLDGYSGRIFLHEYDHLNGKLFTDMMGPVSLKLARDKQAKFMKKLNRLKK